MRLSDELANISNNPMNSPENRYRNALNMIIDAGAITSICNQIETKCREAAKNGYRFASSKDADLGLGHIIDGKEYYEQTLPNYQKRGNLSERKQKKIFKDLIKKPVEEYCNQNGLKLTQFYVFSGSGYRVECTWSVSW